MRLYEHIRSGLSTCALFHRGWKKPTTNQTSLPGMEQTSHEKLISISCTHPPIPSPPPPHTHTHTCPHMQTVIFAHFQLDIDVRSLLDTVGNCGGGFDICALYIDHFCLRPPDYRPIRDDEDDNCPLALSEADLETSNLPQQRSLTSTQPWPVYCSHYAAHNAQCLRT